MAVNPSLTQMIADAASANGVPPSLAIQVALQESSFNPNVTSGAGAQGLFQLMPGTAAQYGVTNPFDATQSAAAGTAYLSDLYAKYGDWFTALVAYNWGPGNVDKYGVSAAPASSIAYANNAISGAGQFQATITPASIAAGVQTAIAPDAALPTAPDVITLSPDDAAALSAPANTPNWLLLAFLGLAVYLGASLLVKSERGE